MQRSAPVTGRTTVLAAVAALLLLCAGLAVHAAQSRQNRSNVDLPRTAGEHHPESLQHATVVHQTGQQHRQYDDALDVEASEPPAPPQQAGWQAPSDTVDHPRADRRAAPRHGRAPPA